MTLVDATVRSYPSWFGLSKHKIKVHPLLLGQHAELLNEDKIVGLLAYPEKADSCVVVIVGHD